MRALARWSRRRAHRALGAVAAGTAALLVLGIALATPSGAITYGTPVVGPERAAPWALSLWWTPSALVPPGFVCSATAVGPREVVTAAHCIQPRGFTYVEVGATALGKGRRVAIEAAALHPSYRDSSYGADIAVLRPLQPLGLRAYARLPSAALDKAVRSTRPPVLGLFGWGEDERGRLRGRLTSVTVRTQPRAARRDYGASFSSRTMLAAGRWVPRAHAWSGGCSGDSGGSLIVRSGRVATLVGVTAFGGQNCATDGPTVFTDVAVSSAAVSAMRSRLPGLAATHNIAMPENVAPPQIVGPLQLGSLLTCAKGTWTSNAASYTFRWYRGAASIGGGEHHVLVAADVGARLRCVVTAASRAGRRAAHADIAVVPAS